LILGNYRNDLLHGDYYLYRDFLKGFLGGVINTDTSKIGLVNKGEYDNDLKSGFWKNYDFTNTLRNEGEYLNGEKNGEWKYYYTNYTNRETGSLSYSRELYLILNYKEGLLDGQSKRFSILNEEKYLCSEDDENETTIDSCIKYVYQKIFEIQNYKNDILNGPYELRDSLNNIFASGKYKNGIKDGEWIEAIIKQDFDGNAYYIYE
jgi:antitoxin component YwqK of YwqJK toxin-antitoxin module